MSSAIKRNTIEEELLTPRKRNSAMIVSFPAGDDSNNNNKVGLSSDDSEDDQHCPAQEPLRKKPKPMATRNWDDFFVALCQYKDQYGHANVHYKYKGRGLADWCAKIRRNEDKLTPEQRSKLKCVGFDFANTQDRNWMANFERLKIYVQKHGSCRQVARDYNDGRGTDLCNWVSKQRSLHGQGRLPKDRVEKLESINFVWRVKDHINTSRDTTKEDEKWMSKYLRLVAYKEKFGTTAVPFQYKEDKSLGRWVNGQRVAETLGNLREDRKALLDEVGFIWRINRSTIGNLEGGQTSASSATSTTAAATTDNQATTTTTTATTTTTTAALPRRIEMNVVSPSSSETESSPENDSKTKGQQHQDQQFTRVDGEIRPHGVSFERMLMRLVNYKKQYGHVNPPPDYAFLGLGPWTVSLRQKDVEGTLEASKVRRLKSIGFLVDGRDQIWNEQFKQLRQYCNLNGHTQVPSWEDPDLCDWVNAQRSLLERNKLRKDRKAKLASIGFLLDVEQSTQLTAQLSGKSIFTKTTDSSEGAGLLALANLWKSSS